MLMVGNDDDDDDDGDDGDDDDDNDDGDDDDNDNDDDDGDVDPLLVSGREVGDCDSEVGSGEGRERQSGPRPGPGSDMVKSGSVTEWMRYQVGLSGSPEI